MSAPTYSSYQTGGPYGSLRSHRSDHSQLSSDSKASHRSHQIYSTIRNTGYDPSDIAKKVQLDVNHSLTEIDREQPLSIRSISAHSIASTMKSCLNSLFSCFRTDGASKTYYSFTEGRALSKPRKSRLSKKSTTKRQLGEYAGSYLGEQIELPSIYATVSNRFASFQ